MAVKAGPLEEKNIYSEILKRKVLRKISGSITENGMWR